jgi:hypothetical protein
MAALIQQEQLDEHGQPTKHRQAKRKVKNKKKAVAVNIEEIDNNDNDEDDDAFSGSDSDQNSDGSLEPDIGTISNDEVCHRCIVLLACVNFLCSLLISYPPKRLPRQSAQNQHMQRNRAR